MFKFSLHIKLVLLILIAPMAQAGHMFTQASSNTPTWIQSGQGIAIDQYGDEGGSGSGNMAIYFEANSTAPTGADTSTSDWWQWSAGDVMRITLPLADQTYTYTFAYDAATGTCAYTACGITSGTIASSYTALGGSGVTLPAHTGQKTSYTSSDVSFSWSIEALAGDFSLGGYRIYTSDGTIDGTGAGPLNQTSVVSSAQVQQAVSGGSTPDIDTAKSEYTDTELNNGSVNAKFTGGTLKVAAAATSVSSAFTVDSNGGVIDSDGDFTISGVISDDTAGSSGRLAKAGTGVLTLSAVNTLSSGMDVNGGQLAVEGSLTGDIVIGANGTLSGSGTVGGITNNGVLAPGSSPGTLTSTGSITNTASSSTQIEIDGDTYSASGGAGSYDRIEVTGAASTYTAGGSLDVILRGISAPANNDFTPKIGDLFKIVTTVKSDGVSGNYASLTQPTSGLAANTRFDVIYGANYINLTVTPDSYSTFADGLGNDNMVRFATATEGNRAAAGRVATTGVGVFYQNLIGLSQDEMLKALGQVSGEIHVMSFNAIRDDLKRMANVSTGHVQYSDDNENLWIATEGYRSKYEDDQVSHGYKAKGGNILVGYDLKSTMTERYGMGVGYQQSRVEAGIYGSSEATNSYLFGYYNDKDEAGGLWSYDIGVGRSKRDISRTVSAGTMVNAHASNAVDSLAYASMSYTQEVENDSKFEVTRFARMSALAIEGSKYSEQGAAATAINIGEISSGDLSTEIELGYRFSKEEQTLPLTFDYTISAYADQGRSLDPYHAQRSASIGTDDWQLKSNNTGDLAGRLSGKMTWQPEENASGYLSVNLEVRDGYEQIEARAGYSVDF